MIVVTTPMCKKIVEWAGLDEFKVNKHPSQEDGDFAILLSESKVEMDSLAIKLNTFAQIKESIKIVSDCLFEKNLIEKAIDSESIQAIFNDYKDNDSGLNYALLDENGFNEIRGANADKKVKVYSEFLKDIVLDIGASVIDFKYNKNGNDESDLELDYDYLVYPDYLEEEVLKRENLDKDNVKSIKIFSHNNISKDPILKAESRYDTLINGMK